MQYSMFSGGSSNTSLAIAELYENLGHTVTLLNIHGSAQWWDDCQRIRARHTVASLKEILYKIEMKEMAPFDIVFEMDHMMLKPTDRSMVAGACIWICRHTFCVTELETGLFPVVVSGRSFEGIKEAWAFEETFNEEMDLQPLKLLTGVPIKLVPYIWTPSVAKTHHEDISGVSWMEMSRVGSSSSTGSWTPHIVEKNTTNTSSAVLPLVILRELKRRGVPLKDWVCNNAEIIVKSKFFMENTVKHCVDLPDLSGAFVGRQRCVEWVHQPLSCVISHLRFNRLRPVLLDLAWCGIPFVHNSDVVRNLGCGLERLFYSENSVRGACAAFETMIADYGAVAGYFANHQQLQEKLVGRFSPASVRVREAWSEALPSAMPLAMPLVMPSISLKAEPTVHSKGMRVGFCDMWEAFNPEYNFFLLMLRSAQPDLEIVGGPASADCNLIIFGPFGNEWKRFPSIPKVHFTGENTQPIQGVQLNLGFNHFDMVNDSYLRFPLWITYIDWFGADADKLVNPKPIPLELCTRVRAAEIGQKKKFCAFIVSNPTNTVRNAAFQWLNEYKPVDSAGRLYNNVGDGLFALGGGGGGELKKMEFLRDYKFCITYENNSARGYTTEKFLHAKAAGCIPIYWGDPAFERDFSTAGCIDARGFKTPEELIAAVRKIDSDDGEWLKRYAVPALDDYKVAWCRRTMAECARRMFALVGVSLETRFVSGPVASVPVTPVPMTSAPTLIQTIEAPIVVTCATRSFLPSLQQWLTAYSTQLGAIGDLKAIIFLSEDVPADTASILRSSFSFASFEHLPTETPPDFPDFWNPRHYGWKLWIYNELARRAEIKGRMILYSDAGSFLCRWPRAWMLKAQAEDVCLLEDAREENRRWCSESFCSILRLTEAELDAKQRLGGLMCFRAGSHKAIRLFSDAYALSKNPAVLVGPKWSGQDAAGKPKGHRHDQSILSILSLRMKMAVEPLDTVYCDISLRKTFVSGRSIYVHRGNFTVHQPFLAGIDEAFVINLDRRQDRLAKVRTHSFASRVDRWPAVEGRNLKLTPAIARLFKPNDFFWKKAVMGCALSHLGLWWKLAHESPGVSNYLILEDDVKFKDGWEKKWLSALEDVPDDYDIIYLGGILPPNREGFVKERVNDSFCRVGLNKVFGQKEPTRYFHFCAYSYILSRQGAQKVLGLLKAMDGYWTSADHILCNPVDVLRSYVLDPVVAGCYQDDDPKYAASNFNDFSRIDGFDSDLWNNDERFTGTMVSEDIDLDVGAAILELQAQKDAPAAVEVNEVIGTAHVPEEEMRKELVALEPAVLTVPKGPSKPFISLGTRLVVPSGQKLDFKDLHEADWLIELLGNPTLVEVETMSPRAPPPTDCPIVIVQRPHVEEAAAMMEKWDSFGAKFKVLHLSDEFLTDNVEFYDLSGCVGIVRNYIRSGLSKKVITIPLGYHWNLREGHKNPLKLTPHMPFRMQDWTFFGTDWNGRKEMMKPLVFGGFKNRFKFYQNWNDPDALVREEYIGQMLDSIFVPCPDGMNPETYRLYECLECGAMPIVVKTEKNAAFVEWLTENVSLLPLSSWDEAAKLMRHLLAEPKMAEVYREKMITSWLAWREQLMEEVGEWLRKST